MNEYKPTLKEIVKELVNEHKHLPKNMLRFCGLSMKYSLIAGGMLYIFPTAIRRISNYESKDTTEYLSSVAAMCIAAFEYMGQLYLYKHTWESGYPEVSLLPVITNAGSFLYESGRKAKQRLIERHDRGEQK